MADNRLLGTGGMYYNNNEISKAYLGNNLVWEKAQQDFLIKANNGYNSGGYWYSKQICTPTIYIHNTNNKTGSFLLKIGLINYFTYTYAYNNLNYSTVIDNNYGSGYPRFYLQMGNGGVQCCTYAYAAALDSNSANVGKYREYEITLKNIKDVTNNKTVSINNNYNYIPKTLRLWPALGSSYVGYCNCAYHYIQVYMDNILIHDYHTGKVGNYYAFIDNVNSSNNIVLNETNTNNNVSLFSEVSLP